MGTPFGHKYIPCNYIDPSGDALGCTVKASGFWAEDSTFTV